MSTLRIVRSSFVWVLLLVCLCALPVDTALATNPQTDPISDATVNLYCRLKAGKKLYGSTGSGVFIDNRGIILTNAHVAQFFLLADRTSGGRGDDKTRGTNGVTAKCSVRTGSPAKERWTASVLYFPPTWVEENASELSKSKPKGTGKNDFALLYITDTKKKGPLPSKFPTLTPDIIGNIAEQEIITIAGYPAEKLDFDGIRDKLPLVIASSTVTHTQGFAQGPLVDVLTLAPSAAGNQGISGGPVVDDAGEVVGIVTSKGIRDNDRTLRAITLAYIDRMMQAQTARALDELLDADLSALAAATRAALAPDTLMGIARGLVKKK